MPKSGRMRKRPTNAKAVEYWPNGVGPIQRAARKPSRNRRTFEPSPTAEKSVLRASVRPTLPSPSVVWRSVMSIGPQ